MTTSRVEKQYVVLELDIIIKYISQVSRLICRLTDDRLFKHATLSKLDVPNENNLSFLRDWLERPTMGSFPIRGLDMGAWDVQEDLVALKSAGPRDLTTRWFTNTLVPLYHRFLGERLKVRISYPFSNPRPTQQNKKRKRKRG